MLLSAQPDKRICAGYMRLKLSINQAWPQTDWKGCKRLNIEFEKPTF